MKRRIIKSIATVFALLGIVFIPFPFNITHIQLQLTDVIFGKLIGFTATTIFSKHLPNTKVYSDSISMYILLLLLFIIAVIIVVILERIKKWRLYSEKTGRILYQFFIYYLVLQLMKYGADKIFKNQFYAPEPNTLFTPFGKMEKDLLYWSTLGTSYTYNIFLGSIEILAAVLMLFKRSRLAGLLLSLGILVNVVAVNFGFDISVKLFSLFLVFLDMYLLFPYYNRLYQLLLPKNNIIPITTQEKALFKKTFFLSFVQWLATGLILLEVFYPFMISQHFNDDSSKKNYLHGAYQVTGFIEGNDTIAINSYPIKRFFIHRDSYIIFQYQQDKMQDYKLQYNTGDTSLTMIDYKLQQTILYYSCQPADSILTLQYFHNNKAIKLTGKAIDYTKLPALKKGFHWTMDDIP